VEPHADAGSDQHWRWQLGRFLISSGGRPKSKGLSEVKPQRLKDYADVIFRFLAEFDRCSKEFNNLKPQFALFAIPFDVDAESVSEEFQMEVLDLKCDKQKQKYTCTRIGVPDFDYFFQKKVSKVSLCSLRNSLMAMFGCTYVCEEFFSSMKINKSAL